MTDLHLRNTTTFSIYESCQTLKSIKKYPEYKLFEYNMFEGQNEMADVVCSSTAFK